MLAVLVIALSSAAGLFGGPMWVAVASGLLLAMVSVTERVPSLRGAYEISSIAIVASVGTSVVLAQMASIGTYAVGRLLGGLLLA